MNYSIDPYIQQQLKEENLRYVSDQSPGLFRQKLGKKFKFYDLDGETIKDKNVLERINKLIIPPAWKNVWIAPLANAHLQATGIDKKGRKQYIYHSEWTKICQENKFLSLVDFGLSLPKIRSQISHDLALKKMEKRKIIATVIWLLEHTFIRIGNEEYSKENNSFGLTTLRNKHVNVKGSEIYFQFRGKSGVPQTLVITNKLIAKTIKKCVELPGYELFQFIDEKDERHVIDSSDVNEFLKDLTKGNFTAKDFRTWGATNLSANHLYKLGWVSDAKIIKQNIVDTVKKVAAHLNNTIAVCRNYYIHPTVLKTYKNNILPPHFLRFSTLEIKKPNLSWDEFALIKLLQKNS
ncbi:DNA topoisomerase IB [Candidatus Daviesbacteria bacterium]|nr:DNA topoisomerase IB [Candidatus Daviesbacteria bacterium]